MGRTVRDNAWVASQLSELAGRCALADRPHRSRAYQRAAETVSSLRVPIAQRVARDGRAGLQRLSGVGPQIAAMIGELLETGITGKLERMRREVPVDVPALLAVDGLGPRTLKLLWEKLRIRTLDDLEEALGEGRVEALPGFGPRRCERLRRAVAIQRRGHRRIPRERAAPVAARLRNAIARHPDVADCAVAGSLRRRLTAVGDIDLVAATENPSAVADLLLRRPEVEHIYSRGPRRVSVRLKDGIDVDLRTIAPESFGSALLYFTGSRAHTLALRRLALAQGLHLNEYGLFREGERIAGTTEREVYEALALGYVAPEERRGGSEIRDALRAQRNGRHERDEGSVVFAPR